MVKIFEFCNKFQRYFALLILYFAIFTEANSNQNPYLNSYPNLANYTEIFRNTNNENLIFSGGGLSHNIMNLNVASNTTSVLAGSISSGFKNGNCSQSLFNNPTQIAGYYVRKILMGFFVLDVGNFCIRFINIKNKNCTVSTALGNCTYQGTTTGLGSAARLPTLKTISLKSDGSYVYSSWNTNMVYKAYVKNINGEILLESSTLPIFDFNQIRSTTYIKNYNYSIFNSSSDELLLVADYNRLLSFYDGNVKKTYDYIGSGSGTISAIKQYNKFLFILKSQESNTSLYVLNSTGSFQKINCSVSTLINMNDFEFTKNNTLFYSYTNGDAPMQVRCDNFSYEDVYPNFTLSSSRSITTDQTISKSKTFFNFTNKNRSKSIFSNETISFSLNETVSVSLSKSGSESISFSLNETASVSLNETASVSLNETASDSVSKSNSVSVSKIESISINESFSKIETASPSIDESSSKNETTSPEPTQSTSIDGSFSKNETTSMSVHESFSKNESKSIEKTSSHSLVETLSKIFTRTKSHIKVIGGNSPGLSMNKISDATGVTSVAFSVATVSGSISIASATSGARTTAAIKVVSGDCDSSSDAEFYENLLGTDPIVLGNFILIFLTIFVLSAIHWFFNRTKKIGDILADSHAIEIGFTFWCFLMPITAQQFLIYETDSSFGIFAIILTGIYLFVPTIIICFFIIRDDIKRVENTENDTPLKELLTEKYKWECRPVLEPILGGYKQKWGFFVDIFIAYLFCFSFMLDDCKNITIMLIATNAVYFILVTMFQFLQPRCVAWGNSILAAGQIAAIALGFQDYIDVGDRIEQVLYGSLVIGTVLSVLQPIVFTFEKIRNLRKKKETTVVKSPVLKDLELSMIISAKSSLNETPDEIIISKGDPVISKKDPVISKEEPLIEIQFDEDLL